MAVETGASLNLAQVMTMANEAFGADKYEESVTLYERCIAMEPDDARHVLSRARAYLKLGKFIEAVADANAVIARLPKLASSYQVKGEALYRLEEYESALDAFNAGMEAASARAKPNIDKWVAATKAAIDGKPVDAATLKAFSAAANAKDKGYVPAPPVSKAPPAPRAPPPQPAAKPEDDDDDDDDDEEIIIRKPVENRVAAAMARPGPSVRAGDLAGIPFTAGVPLEAESKYRWQFFQSANKVTLQVFVKKLNKNNARVKVDVKADHIKVEILDEECKDVEYTVSEELYARIKPDESAITVLGTQVEICLVKEETANWPSLQKSDLKIASNWSDPAAENVKVKYPSSSKAVKDWDKLEVEVKEEEKTENLEGDAALQRLFKQIYSNADEDTRRAMNKSFQESNGTVLSTNWKEVGTKPITCTPPEGVKLHKFEA